MNPNLAQDPPLRGVPKKPAIELVVLESLRKNQYSSGMNILEYLLIVGLVSLMAVLGASRIIPQLPADHGQQYLRVDI